MIHNQSTYLKSKGIPNIRIWILNDSWYTSERFNTVIRDLKHNFMSGLKSDRRILLFGKKIRVDKYFREHQKAKYFTFKRDNTKVNYKQAILNVSLLGRCSVYAFKVEGTKRWVYYASNKLNMTPKIAYERKLQRWTIETQHRDVKQYFGLKDCYSHKKETLAAHYNLSYLLHSLFSTFKMELKQTGIETTMEELWHQYIIESNFRRYNDMNCTVKKHILPKKECS